MNVGLTEVEVVHSSLHEDRILVYVPKGKTSLPYHNPSGCTIAPGLNQPLTEINTRNISWGR